MPKISEKQLLLLLASLQFVNILDFVIMMPLGPHFIADLGVSPAELGFLVSSYTLAASITGLLASRWVNRQPRKKALLLAYGVFSVATVLCGLSYDFWTFLAARTLAGMAGGPATSLVLTIVSDAVPALRRGRALSVVQSAFPVASVVGVPLGLYLANAAGWRAPFLVLGACAFALFALAAYLLPKFDEHTEEAGQDDSLIAILHRVLSDKGSRRAYVTHGLVMGAVFSLVPFLSPYLVNNRGVPKDDLGLFYLFGGALTFVAVQFIGRLTDRFGTIRIYATVAVLFGANMQLILFLPLDGLELVLPFSVFMMLNASRVIPLMTLFSQIPPLAIRGAFMSYLSTVQHMAAGIGTMISGAFLTLGPDNQLQNFNYAAEAVVLINLSVILIARTLQRYAAVESPAARETAPGVRS